MNFTKKIRRLFVAAVIAICFIVLFGILNDSATFSKKPSTKSTKNPKEPKMNSPKNSKVQSNAIKDKMYVPISYSEVEVNYELKRNRPPPIRFKKWYDFAVEKQCNLDEDTYENIYEDLAPFFGMSSKEFNHRLSLLSGKSYMEPVTVKNGKHDLASYVSNLFLFLI